MSLLLLALFPVAAAAGLEAWFLDVGQGDAILLTTPDGRHVLVDGGPRDAHLADRLAALGVERIDLLVVTHRHADHIGGLPEVLERLEVAEVCDPGLGHGTATARRLEAALAAEGAPIHTCRAGDVFEPGRGVRVEVLGPAEPLLAGTRSDLNSNSVILEVTFGQDCLLLTGDAEKPAEDRLLAAGLERCEVLKVAHHGSRHSTQPRFLDAVRPEIAVVSVGAGNRYRHPAASTVEALLARGTRVYRTDLAGLVGLEATGRGWVVTDGLDVTAPITPAAARLAARRASGADAGPASADPDTRVADAAPADAAIPAADAAPAEEARRPRLLARMRAWFRVRRATP